MSRLGVGWLIAGALAGCDPGPPAQVDASSPGIACRRALGRLEACDGQDDKPGREQLITECATEQYGRADDYRALSECAELAGCDELRACMKAIGGRFERRSTMVDIVRALRNRRAWSSPFGRPDEALGSCFRRYAEDEELAALCDELYAAMLSEYRRELAELRDSGTSVASSRCKVLQENADRMPAPAGDEVRALCEEIAVGLEVNSTLSNIALAKSYETQEVPASCATTIERLERAATPWAKGRREEVVRECYVEYGRSLLPRMIARKQCRELGEVVPHLSPLAAEDRALATTLAKAGRACPALKGAK
jgi:hypothetical protein